MSASVAAPVELSSSPVSVQVFRRGATVVRRAELPADVLRAGLPVDVELTGLPLSLLDPTTKVRVLACEPAEADVVTAGVRVGLHVRPGDPPLQAPERKELDDKERALRDVNEVIALLEAEMAVVGQIALPDRPDAESGRAPPPAPLHSRLLLEEFVDATTRARLTERASLRERMRALEVEIAQLQARIAAASSSAQVHEEQLSKSAVVRLRGREGVTPTKLVLELSYVVPGARWAPAYQVKLSRDGSKAEVQMRAWICQRTGEDWKGVQLKLSTASPLRFSELPELSSIRIGRAQPPSSKKGFRPPPTGAEALFRDFDRDRGALRGSRAAPAAWLPPSLAPLDDDAGIPLSAPRLDTPRAPVASRPSRAKRSAQREEFDEKSVASGPAFEMDDSLMMSDGADEEAVRYEAPVAARQPAPAPVMAAQMRPAAPSMAMARPGTGAPSRARSDDAVVEALVFPLLRLAGADDGMRGKLVPVDLRSHYLTSAQRCGRAIPFDVVGVVQRAEHLAQSVGALPVPEGTIDPNDVGANFDYAYLADGVVEVMGDGGFHSVSLGARACEAVVRYIAVPREESSVYRVAALQNPLAAPLLSGPAEIYVGGEYVLTTKLPTVPGRGELKLGLGVEQSIKVARNTRFAEKRSGDKVVAMMELVHDIEIDVVNHVGRAIEIEVRERIPVPAPGAEIDVGEGDVTPSWESYDQEERGQPIEGGRRWQVKVAAGATQQLRARYVVKLFSNAEVVGGNRREA